MSKTERVQEHGVYYLKVKMKGSPKHQVLISEPKCPQQISEILVQQFQYTVPCYGLKCGSEETLDLTEAAQERSGGVGIL